ncbi:ankyrin repeat domain-containing protein [Aspergillus lucknowensis]|uniref:Ankyrin repeat-containing domain protein n=1 Tax=Aspergillus lucknowensis TaxID=176173 RepID=A0ABR4LTF5_9EURO
MPTRRHSLQTIPAELQLAIFEYLNAPQKAALIESDIVSSDLLLRGCPIDECDERDGMSMLHAAARENYVKTTILLLLAGAATSLPCRVKGDDGATPLILASQYGNLEIIHLLMDHGASVTECMSQGETCLHRACTFGESKVVEVLVDYGADVNKKATLLGAPLLVAAEKGHAEILRVLLAHGAKVNPMRARYSGLAALHYAAQGGHVECVRLLLEAGAIATYDPAPEEPGSFIHSPSLCRVAAGPHYRAADDFLQLLWRRKHERLRFEWKEGQKEAYAEILQLLIDAGGDVSETQTGYRATPLHYAVVVGNSRAVKILLAEGTNVNARVEGQSALGLARLMGYEDIVEMLSKAREARPDKLRKPPIGPKPRVQVP